MSANDRQLDVNAYTTLDFVDASALGPDWEDDGAAVLDVRVPDGDGLDRASADDDAPGVTEDDGPPPDAVVLEFELDPTTHSRLEPHVDRVVLDADQARTLADSLVAAVHGSER